MNRDFRPYEGQFFGVFGNLNLNPYTHKGSAPERHTEPRSGPGKAVSTQPHPLEVSPTKVRPSEVDDKVCKGILDEIDQASPEPEKVWRTGALVFPGHPCFISGLNHAIFCPSETAARKRREMILAHPGHEVWANAPYEQLLGSALAEAAAEGRVAILLDEEGREVKRWVL